MALSRSNALRSITIIIHTLLLLLSVHVSPCRRVTASLSQLSSATAISRLNKVSARRGSWLPMAARREDIAYPQDTHAALYKRTTDTPHIFFSLGRNARTSILLPFPLPPQVSPVDQMRSTTPFDIETLSPTSLVASDTERQLIHSSWPSRQQSHITSLLRRTLIRLRLPYAIIAFLAMTYSQSIALLLCFSDPSTKSSPVWSAFLTYIWAYFAMSIHAVFVCSVIMVLASESVWRRLGSSTETLRRDDAGGRSSSNTSSPNVILIILSIFHSVAWLISAALVIVWIKLCRQIINSTPSSLLDSLDDDMYGVRAVSVLKNGILLVPLVILVSAGCAVSFSFPAMEQAV
ncbi:hypothetical protein BJ742DRAFT_899757 [Cladochytrium replicatum]|nr:hypothetical protein BJ742DRAFT_899757 [Cladochytrium replicatum]